MGRHRGIEGSGRLVWSPVHLFSSHLSRRFAAALGTRERRQGSARARRVRIAHGACSRRRKPTAARGTNEICAYARSNPRLPPQAVGLPTRHEFAQRGAVPDPRPIVLVAEVDERLTREVVEGFGRLASEVVAPVARDALAQE